MITMQNIAIIPARAGSKGLPDKNIKILAGKPLLAYAIEAALASKMFDTVMVSTDSKEYAQIAEDFGASVPFLRSEENSRDAASSWDTVMEVLHGYQTQGVAFDTFCLLQPTSPLRTAKDIVAAYNLFLEKKALAVVSVCEMEHTPRWCNTLNESLSLAGFVSKEDILQRQYFQTYYRINGAIYIVNVKEFEKDTFFYKKGAYAYIMNNEDSIDIDTELDFIFTEAILKYKKGNEL